MTIRLGDIAREVSKLIDIAREEGRREVLREVAKADPYNDIADDQDRCYFCESRRPAHAPECLWLRAQQAMR